MLHTDKIKISEDQLTDNEKALLKALRAGDGPMGIADLGKAAFSRRGNPYLMAKNTIRRIVAGGFAKQVARGTYEAVGPKPARAAQPKQAAKPAAPKPKKAAAPTRPKATKKQARPATAAPPACPARPCAYEKCGKLLTGKANYCGPGCRGRASEARKAAAEQAPRSPAAPTMEPVAEASAPAA